MSELGILDNADFSTQRDVEHLNVVLRTVGNSSDVISLKPSLKFGKR